MAMTFGMHLGHVGGPMVEMRKLWRFADANGFDWFSSADHFQESPYRDGNGDCFEAICTIDQLSGGRCEIGIGAGWHQHEYEGFGIPFERIGIRQDHLEEAVQILRMLFDQPISNFKGQYFQLNDWCAKEGRDPKTLARTVNVGFYGGADAKGVARGEAIFNAHWGNRPERKGFF